MSESSALLRTSGLTVRFGGLLALEDASIDVQPGTLTALIGPNGAGKSTLVQVVSGFQRPTAGDVLLRGESIVGRKPHELVRLGLARTFQDVEIFGRLTVAENIAMALPDQHSDSMIRLLTRPRRILRERTEVIARTADILQRINLLPMADELTENLSYGQQKQVVLGRLLATGAELLIFDEPGAGLPRADVRGLGQLLRRVVREEGKTVLLIDHNMELVLEFADVVHVLHAGRVIVSGTPDQIRHDERVMDVYLSRERPGTGHGPTAVSNEEVVKP